MVPWYWLLIVIAADEIITYYTFNPFDKLADFVKKIFRPLIP